MVKFYYYSEEKPGMILSLKGTDEQSLYQMFSDFVQIFDNSKMDNKFVVSSFQRNDKNLRDRLDGFINKYKSIQPQVNQIKTIIDMTPDGCYFYISPNEPLDFTENMKIVYQLQALNGSSNVIDPSTLLQEYNDLFGQVLADYEPIAYNSNIDHKNYIGEADKSKRECRFCGKTGKDEFKKIAHAIPDALGNKTIFLNDECDECNEYFGNVIEKDFIHFVDIFRPIFGIQNKEHKIPTIKGSNFEFKNLGNRNLNIIIQQDGVESKPPFNFILKGNDKIVKQNIYKALVLFALRIVKKENIVNFKETIDWIRSNDFKVKLPKIAILSDMLFFREKPFIMTYIRKNANKSIPYAVGMFQFLHYTYVYIIPTFLPDETDFTTEKDYIAFWNEFNHFSKVSSFLFFDFSDSDSKEMQISMSFTEKDQNNCI